MPSLPVQPQSAQETTALERHELRMRALAVAGSVGALAGIGLLREEEHLASLEHRRGVGLLAIAAALLMWLAAWRERGQRDDVRRRVALQLSPPPNL